MRQIKPFSSKTPYLVVIALLIGMLASDVFANRYDNRGVPADLMRELRMIEDQVDTVQGSVSSLTEYIENETAATGEAYAELCFNASLAVLADGSLGVEGIAEVGIATGVDLYGLLDIQAGVKAEAQLGLVAMLEAGIDLTATICVNAGIANTTSLTIPGDELLEIPAGLEDLLADTHDVMFGIYQEIPALVNSLPVGLDYVDSGINSLLAAANDPGDFAMTTLLNPSAWLDAIDGLPGADLLAARYDDIEDSLNTLSEGDVCGFFDDAAGSINGDLASFTSTVCNAVPASINTGIDFAEDAIDTVWGLVQKVTVVADLVQNTIAGAVSAINSTVNSINSVVNSIKGIVDDVCDNLPGC